MSTVCFSAGCYGKLPVFGDFIRYNASHQQMLLLDKWLQQGLHFGKIQLGSKWNSSYKNAPTYQFVFHPENTNQFLTGFFSAKLR